MDPSVTILQRPLTIGGYSKFWSTPIYYNLIIAMLFDVAESLSNFK